MHWEIPEFWKVEKVLCTCCKGKLRTPARSLYRCHSVRCPPTKCPPGHNSPVNNVPLGQNSLVNNVPPQWITSPPTPNFFEWRSTNIGCITVIRGGWDFREPLPPFVLHTSQQCRPMPRLSLWWGKQWSPSPSGWWPPFVPPSFLLLKLLFIAS